MSNSVTFVRVRAQLGTHTNPNCQEHVYPCFSSLILILRRRREVEDALKDILIYKFITERTLLSLQYSFVVISCYCQDLRSSQHEPMWRIKSKPALATAPTLTLDVEGYKSRWMLWRPQ